MDQLGGSLSPLLQNLRLLSNLNSITALDLASHLLFNFNTGTGTDNKLAFGLFTPSSTGAVPQGVASNPLFVSLGNNPSSLIQVKGGTVVTLSGGVTNQSSFPFTILSATYTNVQKNSLISIFAGASVVNDAGDESQVDLQVIENGTTLTSSRTYQQTNKGSASMTTYFIPTSIAAQSIALKANLVSGTAPISILDAFLSIVET